METGSVITALGKEKDLLQTELATKSSVFREMIGKYERDKPVPSIEGTKKKPMPLMFRQIISWGKVITESLIK